MIYRLLALMLLCVASTVASGCAMCCGVDDYTYPTYGGKWDQGVRTHGRVGSVFSDPSAGSQSVIPAVPEGIPTPGPDPDGAPVSFQ